MGRQLKKGLKSRKSALLQLRYYFKFKVEGYW